MEKNKKRYLVLLVGITIGTFISAQENSQEPKTGYYGIADVGYAVGINNAYSTDFLKINGIYGYTFNPYFSFGLGGGIRYYYDNKDAIIPIFGDFRTNITLKKTSIYAALGVGYSFDLKKNFTIEYTGVLLNPSAGISFNISDHVAMMVGIGYELQNSEITNASSGATSNEYLRAISFNVGISYNHSKFFFRN